MPLVRRLASTASVLGFLAAAVSLAAVASWQMHAADAETQASAERLGRSEEVLLAVSRFRGAFRNIVASERGFLLTRDPAFLREAEAAERRADAALARLRLQLADEPGQSVRTGELAARFGALVARDGGGARRPLRLGGIEPRARSAVAHVLGVADAIEQEERARLARWQQVNERHHRAQLWTVALSFGGFAGMTLLTGSAVYVESRRRRRSERRLAEIVDNLPVTVWQARSHPASGRSIVYVGSRSAQDWGTPADALRSPAGRGLCNVHAEDRVGLAQALDAAQRPGGALDHMYRADVGEGMRWVHARASVRASRDGSLLWTGYWADVTRQKELELSLREATRAAQSASASKSSFLAVMSHEIRTPLNGMLGLLELLALTPLAGEQSATLGVAREAGRSLSRIIDDILDLTRVEAGRMELHPVPASIEEVVVRASQVQRGVAVANGLRLDWRVDPRLAPALVFDPLRVGQILNNFIGNALKFTASGSVSVAAELVSEEGGLQQVRLAVTDTGIGVAPDALARIFEPFVQAEAGTAARYGGSGLGLAICRQLARAMGGDIRMESTVGVGTRIVLEAGFAVAAPQAPSRGAHAMPSLASTLAGRAAAVPVEEAEQQGTLVLVVDDHPVNRLVLARQLGALGYAAITADDGMAALHACASRRIGLVLCDCYMPGWSGFDFARAIRERERLARAVRVPIVACTASASQGERQRCREAGMDACVAKPVDLADLKGQLDTFLPLPTHARAPSLAAVASELLAEFERAHASDLAALVHAVAMRDYAQAGFLAHRMAGAAFAVGAASLGDCCRALAEGARLENGPCMDIDLSELREQTAQWLRELPRPCDGSQATAAASA